MSQMGKKIFRVFSDREIRRALLQIYDRESLRIRVKFIDLVSVLSPTSR